MAMLFLQKLVIASTITCCNKCLERLNNVNETLFNETVNYFFPKDMQSRKIVMDRYLCRYSPRDGRCCHCTKTCRYYGTCCIDTFFNSDILSVEEHVEIFYKMTEIRNYVQTLPVSNIEGTAAKFKVEELPMVASCKNRQPPYNDDIRVIADGFVYKIKYCALCHGFETYTPIELELLNCATSVNVSGIGMTIPDGSCNIKVPEDNSLEYKKANLDISNFSPVMDRSECSVQDFKLCFHSYLALIVISYRRKYANPYCGKRSGETELVTGNCYDYLIDKKTSILITPVLKPHFRMLISFDKDGNSNSILEIQSVHIIRLLMSSPVIVEINHMIYTGKKRASNSTSG